MIDNLQMEELHKNKLFMFKDLLGSVDSAFKCEKNRLIKFIEQKIDREFGYSRDLCQNLRLSLNMLKNALKII